MTISYQNRIACPTCQQTDKTILVEDLYFALIAHDKEIITRFQLSPEEIKSLLLKIKPPELEKLPLWMIQPPDHLLGTILVIIILMTFLLQDQTNVGFLQLLIFPILLAVLYLLGRKYIYSRYKSQKDKREEQLIAMENSVKKWSSFFICLSDNTIFSGHNHTSFPLSELQQILNQ